jgi:hypothetical protein
MNDKPDNGSQQHQGTSQTSKTPSPVLPKKEEATQTGENPNEGRAEPNNQEPPKTQFGRFKKWVWPMKFSDAVMILLTAFIALGTIVSAIAIGFQWHEMHEGGKDTTAIAKASKQQVCAARQIAEASRRNATAAEGFATSAGNINNGIRDAVKKLNSQAEATSKVADQALAQANASHEIAATTGKQLTAFQDAQAAQLSIENVSISEDAEASFVLINRGNSVAKNIDESSGSSERATNIGSIEVQRIDEDVARSQIPSSIKGFTLGPGDKKPYAYRFSQPHGVWIVKFGYLDIFGRERTAYACLIRSEGMVLPCHLATEMRRGTQQNPQKPN